MLMNVKVQKQINSFLFWAHSQAIIAKSKAFQRPPPPVQSAH